MHQVRQGEPGCDLQAFVQTCYWAGARRAQGSWEQFIPLTTFTVCRLERIVIYFSVLLLCPWRDLSSVLNIDQHGTMWLVPSRVTPAPGMGWRWLLHLRTDPCCKTSSCRGSALRAWGRLSSSSAVPKRLLPLLGRRAAARQGKLGAASHPEAEGGSHGEQGVRRAAQGPAGARGHETLAYSRRILPAGDLAASRSHRSGRKR